MALEDVEPASRSDLRVPEQLVDTRQVVGDVHGWSSDISVAESPFTLKVDAVTFIFRGDTTDPGQILIDISQHDKVLAYRLWPDISKWQLSEKGKALYSGEFADMPGWRQETLHVSVDADQSVRRVWMNERLVKMWRSASGLPRLVVAGHEEKITLMEHARGTVPHLELSLDPYFNEGATMPFLPDSAVDAGNGVTLRYESNATPPHNLDLGKLAYRDAHMSTGLFQELSMPYVHCDAMSSDPKRAIFRVPARVRIPGMKTSGARHYCACTISNQIGAISRASHRRG
jgi:hypothetical protein